MTEDAAEKITQNILGEKIIRCRRFSTGLCAYVFKVQTEERTFVLKAYNKKDRNYAEGSVYWHEKLKKLDLKMPFLYEHRLDYEWPYLLMSFIPGDDLGNVYHSLTGAEKQEIARQIVLSQQEIKKLGPNNGYGFLSSYEDSNAVETWEEVIVRHLQRSRKIIAENGFFDPAYCDRVFDLMPRFQAYFSTIAALPFFDDATTKNILIYNGRFSGLVDFDSICFGDDLYTIALTEMSLRNMGAETDYIDFLKSCRGLNKEEERAIGFYTLVFCVDFMSETGMCFNKNAAPEVTVEKQKRLRDVFEKLFSEVSVQ